MAARALQEPQVRWVACRGFNDTDPPGELPDDMAVSAINVVLSRGSIFRKRYGTVQQTITSLAGSVGMLARFVPGQSEAAAELHAMTDTPAIYRVAAGTTASALTLTDAIVGDSRLAHFAVLNGKLYWSYDSAANRLHVYDPVGSTSAVRRVGIIPPIAATVANTGGGAYAATLRYYRIQWLVMSGSDIRRASNLGANVSFTPSGAGTAARVTKPTASSPAEGETHWRVYGSADNGLYYLLSGNIAVGTTTYDDSVNPSDYPDGTAAPTEGTFSLWPSVKYLLSTGDRLVGFGVWETAAGDAMVPYPGRVYFSPVIGTTEVEDDERISNTVAFKGYIDLARNSGAEDRALAGPMDGQILAFQSRGIWTLMRTGNASVPFRVVQLSNIVGSVNQWSTFMGEDESGNPCIYFLDPVRGPYRYGAGGLQWMGYEIQTFWSSVTLPTSATHRPSGVYDPVTKRCMWTVFSSSLGASNLIFHVNQSVSTSEGIRGGWTIHGFANFNAEPLTWVLFSNTLGVNMSLDLKPYYGASSAQFVRTDVSTATDDAGGTAIACYATSKAWNLDPETVKKRLVRLYVQAKAAVGITAEVIVFRNYTEQTRTFTTSIEGFGGSRVLVDVPEAETVDAWTMQFRIGDPALTPQASAFTIDRVLGWLETTSERVGNNMP